MKFANLTFFYVTALSLAAKRNNTDIVDLLFAHPDILFEPNEFSGYKKLTKVTIKKQLKMIWFNSFKNCSSLTRIVFPPTLEEIQNSAFEGCISLANVTFPSSLLRIQNRVFYGCKSLTEITIPSSLVSLGGLAFARCTSLVKVTYEQNSSLKRVGSGIFEGCTLLKNKKIPLKNQRFSEDIPPFFI